MSSMLLTFMPAACSAVIALSRPLPGPRTRTSRSFTPNFEAFSAQMTAHERSENAVVQSGYNEDLGLTE